MNGFVRATLFLGILIAGLASLPNVLALAPSTNIAYISVTGSGSEFRMIHCLTDACDISVDTLLATDAINAYAIANGADQKALIVYVGDAGTKRGLFALKCVNDDCTQRGNNMLVDLPSTTGDLSLVIRPNGMPFITYFNTNDSLLHSYACDDYGCKSGKDRVLDTTLNNGPKSVVKMAPNGFPSVLYWGATTPLHFLFCQDVDCVNSTTTILNNAVYTTDMDFVYGTDDMPVVTFDNFITGAFKIMHCGTITCSGGNTSKLIGINAVGARLAINRPGTPFLFYLQQSSSGGGTHDVKAMKCTTFTCTGPTWNTNFGVSVTPTIPSTLLQANDKPLMVFSHPTGFNHDIELWTCTNLQCSTHTNTLVTSVHNGLGFAQFDVKAAK